MDVSLSRLQELVMDRKPRTLQSMGSQRVGHDRATELKKESVFSPKSLVSYLSLCSFAFL